MQKRTISILGCGWLGLPLAISLQKEGYIVKGSTTSPEKIKILEDNGIEPHSLTISDTAIEASNLSRFLDSEIVIVNFPPKRRADIFDFHTAQMRLLINALQNSRVTKVIFASSTSVYPETNTVVTEQENGIPSKDSGKALLGVEQMFLDQTAFQTTIIRFSGLIGYDRMPGRFLAGKKNIENGDAPINVIHQDDCISISKTIIEKEIWGEIFNASTDEHPKRKDYYTLAAEKIGLEKPTFAVQETTSYKIIDSSKLKEQLEYTFLHPDPLALLND